MRRCSRRQWLSGAAVGTAALLTSGLPGQAAGAVAAKRPNVLFIVSDDLRPELGCYGVRGIKTPNIDRLAKGGVVFTRAYCQQAVCNASRASLMTGLRPDSTKVYDLKTHFRTHVPDAITIPNWFRNNGYHTEGLGKIYHGDLDDPQSWSVPAWRPKGANRYLDPAVNVEIERYAKEKGVKPYGDQARGPAWECADVPDNAYYDGEVADRAVARLNELKDRPFFLAVGFARPHLPFNAPKRYFDLYPQGSVPLTTNSEPPAGVPEIAMHTSGELRNYNDIPNIGPLSPDKALELTRAYYASVSFVDAQIGRLLDELDRLKLSDNTVVVLWGDHGWHLGDNGLWCKHSNFEAATRSPLILRIPGVTDRGAASPALAEFVDLYPTLCDACGLTKPSFLEGSSLLPLLKSEKRPWKKAAFSQYPRPGDIMGRSLRTDQFRYTEWRKKDGTLLGRELYDHRTHSLENANLAGDPTFETQRKALESALDAGWRGALP